MEGADSMNTEFVFSENGIEKKGNLVIAFVIDEQKYILYEVGKSN